MKKVLLGALAAAGLAFAGCERDPALERNNLGGGETTEEGLNYEPSIGGAGSYEGQLEEDPELQEQDELIEDEKAFGGSGLEEDERDLQGIDGSGRESTMQDHTEEQRVQEPQDDRALE